MSPVSYPFVHVFIPGGCFSFQLAPGSPAPRNCGANAFYRPRLLLLLQVGRKIQNLEFSEVEAN